MILDPVATVTWFPRRANCCERWNASGPSARQGCLGGRGRVWNRRHNGVLQGGTSRIVMRRQTRLWTNRSLVRSRARWGQTSAPRAVPFLRPGQPRAPRHTADHACGAGSRRAQRAGGRRPMAPPSIDGVGRPRGPMCDGAPLVGQGIQGHQPMQLARIRSGKSGTGLVSWFQTPGWWRALCRTGMWPQRS